MTSRTFSSPFGKQLSKNTHQLVDAFSGHQPSDGAENICFVGGIPGPPQIANLPIWLFPAARRRRFAGIQLWTTTTSPPNPSSVSSCQPAMHIKPSQSPTSRAA